MELILQSQENQIFAWLPVPKHALGSNNRVVSESM
jgi:hypothetical protein